MLQGRTDSAEPATGARLAPCARLLVSRSGQTRFALKQFFHWKIPLQPTSERLLFPLLFQQCDLLFFLPFTWEIIQIIIGRGFFFSVLMTGFHVLPEHMFPQSRNK